MTVTIAGGRRHELKCHPEFFQPTVAGFKTAEARWNDRDYQVGDHLHVREWVPFGGYTGASFTARVSHVLRHIDGPWLVPGFVMLSLRDVLVMPPSVPSGT